jgi:hypothetical protein
MTHSPDVYVASASGGELCMSISSQATAKGQVFAAGPSLGVAFG